MGWDSEFRKKYESLTMQLHFEKLNDFCDEWDEKYENSISVLRRKKIEKIKSKINI